MPVEERPGPEAARRAGPHTTVSGRRPTLAWPALVAVLGGLTLLTRLPGLVTGRTFNSDEATLAVGGRTVAGSGQLYVDVIDRKPPLPFAAYGLVDGDLRLARLMVVVLVLVAGVVTAAEAHRRWGSRAGWVSGVVMVLGAAALGANDAQAANFELFALLPIVVAVASAARGHAAVAGVALAVAVLCKQPAAVTVVPVAWSWWHTGRWRGVITGGLAGAAAGLVLSLPFGIDEVAEWALLGTGGYLGMDLADAGFALGRAVSMTMLTVGFWGGAWLLVVAGAGRGAAAEREPAGPERDGRLQRLLQRWRGEPDLDLWLLLAVSLVAMVPGFRFFPHYLIQLLPALALLAGRGAATRPRWVRPALAWGAGATVVAAALAWPIAVSDPPRWELDASQELADRSDEGDLVLVWGNAPELYWRADRLPAGGFTHSEFVTGHSGGRRPRPARETDVPDEELYRDWIARIEADPPEVVADTAAAGLRGGDWFPLRRFPALAHLLAERYERVATVDGIVIYELVDPPTRR